MDVDITSSLHTRQSLVSFAESYSAVYILVVGFRHSQSSVKEPIRVQFWSICEFSLSFQQICFQLSTSQRPRLFDKSSIDQRFEYFISFLNCCHIMLLLKCLLDLDVILFNEMSE